MGQQLIHQYPVPKETDFNNQQEWALALEIWLERLQTNSSDAVQTIVEGNYSVYTVATTSKLTPVPGDYDQYNITAQDASTTIANHTGNVSDSQKMIIRIKDNGTGREFDFSSYYRGVVGTLPTTTTANKTMYLGFIWNNTDTKWDYVAYAKEA